MVPLEAHALCSPSQFDTVVSASRRCPPGTPIIAVERSRVCPALPARPSSASPSSSAGAVASGTQTKGPNGEGRRTPVVPVLVRVRVSRVGMVEDGGEAVAVVEVGADSAAVAPRLAAAAATAARRELVFFFLFLFLFLFLCFFFFGSPLATISVCAGTTIGSSFCSLSPAQTPPPRTLGRGCLGAIFVIERPLSSPPEATRTG